MTDLTQIILGIKSGDFRSIARAITIVENDLPTSKELLQSLNQATRTKVIGVTGSPGSGKSTLVNCLVSEYVDEGRKVAVVAVDPTSPFTKGSLLGDRIRMSKHFNTDNVFIRSLATRGFLGGLSKKAIQIVDILASSKFDVVIVETVGVGQSEIDIVALSDQTILVLAPDGGDDIQHVKSGIMEIASLYVVNKSDRDGAEKYSYALQATLREQEIEVPVFNTNAAVGTGVSEIYQWINHNQNSEKKINLAMLAEKAITIISQLSLESLDKSAIMLDLSILLKQPHFNIYTYCLNYTNTVLKSRL